MMVWIEFVISAALIVVAAMQLAKWGDVIAARTGMGGMFIGVLLLAGATSLPELIATVSAVLQGAPNLAAGNLLGSNMFNMFTLAILDLLHRKERLLRKAALKHALTGSLAVFLIGAVVFFVMADIPVQVGWVGLDSLALIAAYVLAVRLIQQGQASVGQSSSVSRAAAAPDLPVGTPSLARGVAGFALAAGVLTVVTPWMVRASSDIAVLTGLGQTFVGSTLVAFVTSLPELVTTLAALRLGADDMAIGNLFGSNLFNMFALGLTDLFYVQGRFLGAIDPTFLLVGMLGLIMTALGLIGNLARLERRVWFVEIDALALMAVYIGGLWLLYTRGLGG